MSTGTNRERIEQNNTLLEGIKTQIQNLPEAGGSGDIKQFATQEEMQADTTAKEGDLAVVYRSEIQNATVDSRFQVATFPETVVLDTAITSRVEVRYRAVDSSKMFDCWGGLNSSNFMMDCRTESGEVRIQYTSSDGITYTRTDSTGNPVDFGTEIYYERPDRWNDVIGKFIQVGGSTFEGLYEYKSHSSDELIEGLTSVVSPSSYQTSTVEIRDIQRVVELVEDKFNTDVGLGNYPSREYLIIKINNIYRVYFGIYIDSTYGNTESSIGLLFADNKSYTTFGPFHTGTDMLITDNLANTNGTTYKPYCYDVDITNETVTDTQLSTSSFTQTAVSSKIKMKGPELTNLGVIVQYNVSNEGDIAYNVGYITSDGSSGTIKNVPTTVMDYLLADTQFTLNSGDDVLYNAISYGKNGIVKGTLPLYMKAIQPSKERITLDDGIYKNCYISAVTKSIDENIQPCNIASGVSILHVNGALERVTENYINDNATSKIFTSANFSSVIDSDQYVSPVVLDTKGNILGLMYTSSNTNCYLCAYDSSNNTFPNRTYFSYSQIDSTYGRLQDLNSVRFSHIDEFGKGYMYWINGYHINRVDVLYDYALKKFTFDYSSKKHYDYSTFYTGTNQISSTFIYDFKINPKNINQILCRLCVRHKRSSSSSKTDSELYFCTFECTDDTDMKLLSKVSFGDVSDNSNTNGGNVLNILNDSKLAMYSPNNYAADAWASVGPTIFIVLDDNFNILKVTNTNGKVQSINKEHTKMLMSTSLSYSTNKVYNVYDISIDYTNGNITFTKTNKTVSNGIHTNACISYDGEYLIDYYMIDGTNTRKNIAVYKIDFNTDTIYTKLLELTPPTTSTSSYGAYSLDYLGECTSTNIFFGSSYTCYVQILLLTKILDSITYKNKTFTSAPITQNEYDQALTTSEDILGITQDNQVGEEK